MYRTAPPRAPRTPLSTAALIGIVLGAIVISQVAALAYLGYVAGGSTTGQSCAFSLWIFKVGCSTTVSASPTAENAQQLASTLSPVFAVLDVVLFVILAVIAVANRGLASQRPAARRLRSR